MSIAFAAAWAFVKANWRLFAIAGAVLALLGAVWGFVAHERHLGRIDAEQAQEAAREKAAAIQAAALIEAATQREADNAATAAREKDLTHAYAATPDSKPSAARLALACRRLRLDAGPRAKLPAACGPSS